VEKHSGRPLDCCHEVVTRPAKQCDMRGHPLTPSLHFSDIQGMHGHRWKPRSAEVASTKLVYESGRELRTGVS
jgi:hypothetical protein